MQRAIIIFMIAFGLVLTASAANAFDYNNWVPMLPESISGMEKQDDPDGMNMEKGGKSWSTIKQEYADGNGKDIQLSIITGSDAPGIREFEQMQQFEMESGEQIVKTLEVSGYKAVLDLNKKGGTSNLLISVQNETLVIIETRSFDNEKALVSLAKEVPLDDMADSVK